MPRAVTPVVVLVPPTWIGGLGAMRSLGRMGIPVYGLAHRGISIPNVSRFCAGTIQAGENGRPTRDPGPTVEALRQAGSRLGNEAILIPGTDEWAVFVAAHATDLLERFRFPQMPVRLVEDLASKVGLYRLAQAHGLGTPRVVCPRDGAEAAELAQTLQYPVMVKPVWSRPDVVYKAVATEPRALLAHFHALAEQPASPNVMFQEYIPGRDEDVWIFNGYFDQQSRCLAAFTGQKIRQDPPHMGMASLGVCRQNRVLIDATSRFLAAVGYRGIVDIGFRFDNRDGEYKVLDVNPRLGGAFRLFVDANGLDVVRALYLDLTGQKVPEIVPREGRRWFREDSELIALKRYRRLDGLSFADWLRSFRGVEEAATFSPTDPAPFFCSMALVASHTLHGRLPRMRQGSPPPTERPESRSAATDSAQRQEHQRMVNQEFHQGASFWKDVYQGQDVFSAIHQRRLALALEWIDRLPLPRESPVLDVGCGAGVMAVSLARRGFSVSAVDPAEAVIHLTLQQAVEAGVKGQVAAQLGDAQALEFADGTFALVVALGVIPWLHSPQEALRQMARVLEPGGWLIVNADNRMRLHQMVDPWYTPFLARARGTVKHWLRRGGGIRSEMHGRQEFDALLSGAGFQSIKSCTFGFGPFSFLGRRLLPDGVGVALDRRLQQLADRGVPGIRSAGAQYLVLARKPGAEPQLTVPALAEAVR